MFSFYINIGRFGRSLVKAKEGSFDWCRDWRVSKNKSIEAQISHWDWDHLFSLRVDTYFWGSDHAGPEINLEMFGWFFNLKFYDHRHWNYDAGRFMTEAEHKAEAEEWEAGEAEREAKRQAHIARFDSLMDVDTEHQPS